MVKDKVEANKAKRDKKSKKRIFAFLVPFCLICFTFPDLQPAIYLESAGSQSHAQNSASQNETPSEEELIKLARAAIGGEDVLRRIETITATGKYKRFVNYISVQSPKKVEEKRKALPGKMEFEFALPDKFRRRVAGARLRGFDFSFAQVVSGAEAWRDPPARPMSSSGDRRVIDVGDVEKTEFIQATSAKQELSYYSIGWLMRPLPGYPLEMSYLGCISSALRKLTRSSRRGGADFGSLCCWIRKPMRLWRSRFRSSKRFNR